MSEHRHFILHKPFGVLSQFINNKTRKKRVLSDIYDFPEGTMAIGRLDVNSEGLLLLTTDGKVSEAIRSRKFEKEYIVQVDGIIDQAAINQLIRGVKITVNKEEYHTLPCHCELVTSPPNIPNENPKVRSERHGPTSWAKITIHEGKNRQVRKMTAAVGFPTLRLIRLRIGNIHLRQMKSKEVIEVDHLLTNDTNS